ncbi:MAG TPA: hypothetical protein EYO40_08850 [Phycisphaerales bacterium]|nr:hypothetical protein [Phycisphaerales bacterium]
MSVTTTLCIAAASIVSSDGNVQSDWSPQVYNAIKWTAPNQGQLTIDYTSNEGISRVPIAYHGGVDMDASGEITDKNILAFKQWVEQQIPQNYCGPIVLDYEQPWWKELRAQSILPERLHEILSVYIQGMDIAKQTRPDAQWGYWGIPGLRHTTARWREYFYL